MSHIHICLWLERVQRNAARFIKGDYKSRKLGSMQNLLNKLELPTLQERRRKQLLVLFYKVVEGLVPAIPKDRFITPHNPEKRLIRPKKDKNSGSMGAFALRQFAIEQFLREAVLLLLLLQCH